MNQKTNENTLCTRELMCTELSTNKINENDVDDEKRMQLLK